MQPWPIVLIFLPRVVVFKFLLFSNSNNVLVTLLLKCNPTSSVFRLWIWSMTVAFHSKFLDYIFWFSKNVFLIFEPVFPYLLSWTIHYLFWYANFSYCWTCFFHCTKIVSNIFDEVILITLSRFRTIIINSKINLCILGGVHQSANLLIQVRATI